MTRRNFIILYIGILLFFLALTSCGSKKQCVVLPSDFKGPKELSRLYGVRLTPNDNIFYTMKEPDGLASLIGWVDWQRKEWIAPVLWRLCFVKSMESSWHVLRLICWSIIARKSAVSTWRKVIWSFSGRAKEGRKCLTMSGSIWKMVSLSIPVHRTVWSSVAWVNLTMSGHGLPVAGWRICDFLWITRLFYVKTTIK